MYGQKDGWVHGSREDIMEVPIELSGSGCQEYYNIKRFTRLTRIHIIDPVQQFFT